VWGAGPILADYRGLKGLRRLGLDRKRLGGGVLGPNQGEERSTKQEEEVKSWGHGAKGRARVDEKGKGRKRKSWLRAGIVGMSLPCLSGSVCGDQ